MALKIKFFITPVYPYGNDHYYHEMIGVAEGFEALGYKVIGNADYWFRPETNDYLIKFDESKDYDVCIYDYRYVTSFAHLLFREGYPNFEKGKKHILIDRNDWIEPIWNNNPHYKIFDLIFAGNIYENYNYPSNIRPWVIGLTDRIMKVVDKFYKQGISRESITGVNFRVDHNVRGYVLEDLKNKLKKFPVTERLTQPVFDNETDSFYYKTSIRRHNPDYYKLLCNTRFFAAFGGYYDFKPFMYQPFSLLDKIKRKPAYWNYRRLKKKNKDFSDQVFIFQHDNFRFWEVLYSGAVAINLDMQYWNFKLPAMPTSGEHYIGVKKLKDNAIETLIDEASEETLNRISVNGREWVKTHYSPVAQAQRILKELDNKR